VFSYHAVVQVGQAVTCNGAAAFSEFAVAKALMCTPVPAATPEAVALSLSAVTACCALEATAGVKAGDTVAVTAAAGGTGHFGVQLAKLAGAKVVAITGSPEKVDRLRQLGADVVICHRSEVRFEPRRTHMDRDHRKGVQDCDAAPTSPLTPLFCS
jgi:NADPH:quinone reductase-like Zn-dependent oxidoreductase